MTNGDGVLSQSNGELQRVGLELVGKVSELGAMLNAPVTTVILGKGIRHLAPILIQHDADRVVIVEDPLLKTYNVVFYTKALFQVIERERSQDTHTWCNAIWSETCFKACSSPENKFDS